MKLKTLLDLECMCHSCEEGNAHHNQIFFYTKEPDINTHAIGVDSLRTEAINWIKELELWIKEFESATWQNHQIVQDKFREKFGFGIEWDDEYGKHMDEIQTAQEILKHFFNITEKDLK